MFGIDSSQAIILAAHCSTIPTLLGNV